MTKLTNMQLLNYPQIDDLLYPRLSCDAFSARETLTKISNLKPDYVNEIFLLLISEVQEQKHYNRYLANKISDIHKILIKAEMEDGEEEEEDE